MLKHSRSFLFSIGLLLTFVSNVFAVELPTEKSLQSQIDTLQKEEQTETVKSTLQNLQDTQNLLSQLTKQKADTDQLRKDIDNSAKSLAESKSNIEKLTAQEKTSEQLKAEFSKLSTSVLQAKSVDTLNQLQSLQTQLTSLNANLSSQKTAPERTQAALAENLKNIQTINEKLSDVNLDNTLRTKLVTEQALAEAKNAYNQVLLSGNEALTALYTSQVNEKNLAQQQLQLELTALQDAINEKNLQQSQQQAEKAAESQQKNVTTDTNPVIVHELELNTIVTKELLEQTSKYNELSQDNLRIKGILDNLQQTQHNIEEQISALQGTLVLSRIINKQKQALPQDSMIKGLSKQIADLRVRIFDVTEFKNNSGNTETYIANLEKSEKVTFTNSEKKQLQEILLSREKSLTDLLKQLNSQLNVSINLELNQQQVQTISDTLQEKLKQQSFWVKSNNNIDLKWFSEAPLLIKFQLREIGKIFDFSNWKDNLAPAMSWILLLVVLTMLILRKKNAIKQRLNHINNKIKSIGTDNHWNTPLAIFWTLILCLPSTFMFLAVFIFVTYICFQDPAPAWPWGLKMSFYWLYFAFLLAMLRPNGIAYSHFGMPRQSNETFRNILKRSVWVIALMLNTSIFTNLDMGVTYDVIGQVMTIIMLVVTIFIVAPAFRKAISDYQKETKEEKKSAAVYSLYAVRAILLLAPIILIVLIACGYYYTGLVIIEHLVATYFAAMSWVIFRNIVRRGFAVTARRLAAKRLQEKREQARLRAEANENAESDGGEVALEVKEETLAVSEVKHQISKITDFLLWFVLFGLMYWVWSDLVTVAYYLDGVTLWKQSVVTETGTVMESVTLFNLLIAVLVLFATYVLIRNIGGLLEVFVFSNLELSQGTPYTITTLLTYIIIALGATLAFGTLGMSWSKLQWLFAALSVGLGFGMQEIFANFVSGIIILFERPVRIGDQITIGEFTGTVSRIKIRATTLIDYDKKEIIVPNKAFVTERIVNWALTTSVTRVVISVGVAYGSDLELVRNLLLQAAEENDKVLKEPKALQPMAYFLTFGASTLDHELRVYVGDLIDRTRTLDALNRRIHELFAEHNIEIAFNQLDVFIKNQETNEEVKVGSEKFPLKNL
ncbi:mechanosensitive channel MscK [Pasteurella bettyae]|uniref:mechanosensitive channel MscK n=1 Tax=Pasteurella bettyae TaxID=752 RepID=UPI003D28C54F